MEQAIEQSLRRAARKIPDLQRELAVSQPTLSRALTKLERQGRVLRIGSARATRYAAIRTSLIRENSVPVYEIDTHGEARRIARLTPVYPAHFAVVPEANRAAAGLSAKPEVLPSLPYYLRALQPEGFLGRSIAARVGGILGIARDPREWNEDQILLYATMLGDDLPGALIVGEESITNFLSGEPRPATESEAKHFLSAAEKAETGESVGSSAGGEQPKFTAFLKGERHAIVKFSSAEKNSAAARWRDLLICEHIALDTLRSFALKASETRLVFGGNRVFLVIERHDRVGVKGRRHYFSFGALDDAFHGDRRDLRKSARYFYENDFISQQDLTSIELISLFGDLIGNTDQHYGNTSFTRDKGPFTMAPAYDVLPMWYAPSRQGNTPEALHPLKPILPEFNGYKKQICEMAHQFWTNVGRNTEVSRNFHTLAKQNLTRIQKPPFNNLIS